MMSKDMQPINSKACVAEVVWGPFQDIALQVASIVIDHHLGRCSNTTSVRAIRVGSDSC